MNQRINLSSANLSSVLQKWMNWQESNPLFQFRKDHQISRSRIATMIGVSMTSIQNWETGVSIPDADNMARITQIVGVEPKDWEAWLKRKPKMEGGGLIGQHGKS